MKRLTKDELVTIAWALSHASIDNPDNTVVAAAHKKAVSACFRQISARDYASEVKRLGLKRTA